jgi:aminopeptidase N
MGLRYQLSLFPDTAFSEFDGKVVIENLPGNVTQVNASRLLIHSVTVDGEVSSYVYDEKGETLTFSRAGKVVEVAFSGKIGCDGGALYRSDDGGQPALASMLFSTYARRVFPCVDEPRCKAVIAFDIIVEKDLHAFSNAPVKSEEEQENGLKRVFFESTPIMSTYLFAVYVGQVTIVEKFTSKNQIPVRALAPVGKEAGAEFAVEVAVRSVDFFEEFFSKQSNPINPSNFVCYYFLFNRNSLAVEKARFSWSEQFSLWWNGKFWPHLSPKLLLAIIVHFS